MSIDVLYKNLVNKKSTNLEGGILGLKIKRTF